VTGSAERLHYFPRMLLGSEAFTDEQVYHRTHRRRHNLGPHGIGIVTGLHLAELPREGEAGFVDLVVMPGLAIDLFGREILVLEPAPLDTALFASLGGVQNRPVWISYEEQALRDDMAERRICEGTDSYSRVRETFRLFGGPQDDGFHDLEAAEVFVAGATIAGPSAAGVVPPDLQIPADGGVAVQEFEAPGEQRRWMLQLGSVLWDSTQGRFAAAAGPEVLAEGRIYAGFVGAALRSESGALSLAPRAAFADPDAQDFAAVEGRLRIAGRLSAERNMDLWGRQFFLSDAGFDDGIPLSIGRRPSALNSIDAELHIELGEDPDDPARRLTVGTGGPANQPVLAVRGDRRVDLADGKLRFPGQRSQVIDLSLGVDNLDGPEGLGVQDGAQYTRTSGEVYWYRGGAHDDTAGAPGQGGATLLRLDGGGRLHFGDNTRQMLNLWRDEYAIGVQNSTFYCRANRDFAWFRGGSHVDLSQNPGPGGTTLMVLDRQGRLTFDPGLKQTLNLHNDDYGVGVQNATLYFRSNFDYCWFLGGLHDDGRSNPGGGQLAMKYDTVNGFAVTGDLRTTQGLVVRGVRAPVIDVQNGMQVINQTPVIGSTASGVFNLDVNTRLTAFSNAQVMVALSDIRNNNAAVNARWRVQPNGPAQPIGPSTARFPIFWQVDDSDGFLVAFSWIAIFTH